MPNQPTPLQVAEAAMTAAKEIAAAWEDLLSKVDFATLSELTHKDPLHAAIMRRLHQRPADRTLTSPQHFIMALHVLMLHAKVENGDEEAQKELEALMNPVELPAIRHYVEAAVEREPYPAI